MPHFETRRNTECQQCYTVRSNDGGRCNETYDAPASAMEEEDIVTTNTIDRNGIDQILSAESSNLEVRDRESINEEVHGVRYLALPETAEMLTASLSRLT